MSIVAETLNRLQSARRTGHSSRSPLERGSSTHMDWPLHLSKKLRGRMTFWLIAFGLTLALTTIGFGMYWFDVTIGPMTPTRLHPLPLRTARSRPAESLPAPESSVSIPAKGPSSNMANPVRKKTLSKSQYVDRTEPTPETETLPLSKPGRSVGERTTPNAQPNSVRLPITSPRSVEDELKQQSLRSTTIAQAITNKTSTPLSASRPTLKERQISLPAERAKHREILQPDKKPDHKEKHVPHATSRSHAPISPLERFAQVKSHVRQHRYLEAMEVLEPLFLSLPEDWESWFWMGTAQLGLEHYEEAREAFQEGLARDETIPQLWVQWAIVEQQRGKYSQSLDALRQAELLAPALPEVQLNLAFSLESLGHTRPAREHYHQYLSLTHHNPVHRSTRKKVLDRILHLE